MVEEHGECLWTEGHFRAVPPARPWEWARFCEEADAYLAATERVRIRARDVLIYLAGQMAAGLLLAAAAVAGFAAVLAILYALSNAG